MCVYIYRHYLAFIRGTRSRDSVVVIVVVTFVPRRTYSLPSQPLRENSRATNYLLGLSSHGLSNIAAMLSCPTLPRTFPYDVSTRACICKVELNARGLKKKKELLTKKKQKREKKALLVFKWRIVIVSGA